MLSRNKNPGALVKPAKYFLVRKSNSLQGKTTNCYSFVTIHKIGNSTPFPLSLFYEKAGCIRCFDWLIDSCGQRFDHWKNWTFASLYSYDHLSSLNPRLVSSLLLLNDVRFVYSTEKGERSNACAQTQQRDRGIDIVGEKQSKSF